jgi:hypothetical protein
VDRPLNLPVEAGDRPGGALPQPGHVLGQVAELLVGSPDLGRGLSPLGLVDLIGLVRHHVNSSCTCGIYLRNYG